MVIIPQEKRKIKLPPLSEMINKTVDARDPLKPLTTPSLVTGPNTTSTPPASTQPTAPVKSWDQMSMWEKTKAFVKEIPNTVLDPNNYTVPKGKSWDELNAMQKISGVAQEIPRTITDPAFLKTIPRTVYESEKEAAKIPIKFTYSAIQALKPGGDLGTGIKDILMGKATPTKDDSLNLPIFGKVSTYQKDFVPIADEVIEGKRPLWHALAPFVQVPLDAMFTSSLLDMGAKYILKKIPVNNAQVAAAINKLGLTDLSPEAQSIQYRKLAHEFHPDLAGEKSTKLMSELNNANDILEKAREQGTLVSNPSGLAAAMRDLAEKGTSDVRDLFKFKDTSPYLDVKGLLPEQAGTIPEPTYKPYRQPAFGLSIKEVGGKPIPRPEPLQRALKSFQYNLEMQVARYSPEGGDIIKNLDLSKVASVDEAANLAMSSLPPKIAQDKVIADSVTAWRDSAKQIQQFQEETIKPISNAIKKINNAKQQNYYLNNNENKFIKVDKSYPVQNDYGLDLFVSKNPEGKWTVTEGKSGLAIGSGDTKSDIVGRVNGILKYQIEKGIDINKTIDAQVSLNGLSPKYSKIKNEAKSQVKLSPNKLSSIRELSEKSAIAENSYRDWLSKQPDAVKKVKEIQEQAKTIPNEKNKQVFLKNAKQSLDTEFLKKYKPAEKITSFYRGGGEGSMPKGKTAEDVINYEKQDLGNDIKVEPGINPKEIKSENLTWVTDTPEAAKEYGAVSKVSIDNGRVIARDNYGGALVEKVPKTITDPVLKATNLEDIANELSKEYGGKIPLYHATSLENAKKIISDGLQTTQGKNYKHWGDEDQIYFQVGKSDYKSTERPVVFKTEVDKDWFIKNASADMDGVSVTEKDILDKTGVDISELDSDTRDLIQAYYNNGKKFRGLELLVRNPEGGDLTIKNIEQVAGPKVVDEKKKAIAKLLQVLSKPPKIPPVSPRSVNKMIQPKPPMITKREDILLRMRLRAEDMAGKATQKVEQRVTKRQVTVEKRQGIRNMNRAVTETRTRIYDKLRTKMAEMKDVKDQIIGYVKETIPPKDRGRFLNMVATAKTQRNLIKSFVRIDKVAEAVQKKIAVSELAKKLKDIENSGKISVEYKPIIKKMVEDIELKGHTSGKIEELKSTREFIEREKAKGNDVTMPEYVLDSLKILDRKPLKDLSLMELQVISDKIDVLRQLGETKLASKEGLDNLIKEKWTKELKQGTVPLEKNPLIAPKLRHVTIWEKVKNSLSRGKNAKMDVDLALTDPEVLADMLDGNAHYLGPNYRIFFKPQSINYGNYLQGRVNFHDTVIDLLKKNGIQDVDLFGERLFIELNKHQKGGIEKLLENGYTQAEIDSVKLTPGETNIYNFVREYYDNAGKRAESFIQKTYNKEFKLQENYSPWWTDYKAMSESIDPATSKAPEVWEKFANPIEYRPPKKTVEFGWMKSRTGGKNIIKHNAIEDLLKHNDDLEYMTNMGADTKRLFEVANSPEYAEMAGKEGQSRMLTWLNSIARKGGSIGETQTGWIDAARGAVGAGSMAFKLSTVLVQFTSIGDAATQIGPWAFKGMYRFATSKEARDFLYKNAPEWKARFGKEYAMSEFSTNKILAKYQQMGYKPMAKADSFTAGSALLGAYEKYLVEHGLPFDLTTVNKDAMYEAQRIMRRTQGTGEFIYQPPEIVHGVLTKNRSLSKAIWQFQSFNLTGRWNYIKHDLWVYGIKEKNPKIAINMLFWLTVAAFAGVGMRQIAKKATGGDINEEDTLTQSTAQELLQTIPFVSMITSMGKFKGEPVPILDIPRQVFTATDQIGGKTPETKRKGYIKLIEVLGKASGVPGASQAGELARNLSGSSSTKKSSSLPNLPGLKKTTNKKRKGLPKLKKISR